MRLRVLPLVVTNGVGGDFLNILSEKAVDAAALQELRFAAGMEIHCEEVASGQLADAIIAAYQGAECLPEKVAETKRRTQPAPVVPLASAVAEAPVPQLLDAIIHRAVYLAASDIHIEPEIDHFRLRFRIDGRLQREKDFSVVRETGRELIRRIKVLSSIDITVERGAQDGGFSFSFADRELRLRVSLVPAHVGQKAVLRLLDNAEPFLAKPLAHPTPFVELGLNSEQSRLLIANLGAASGSVILSGPTGSGKSTLLYAALEYLNKEWRNIVSLEDPIERLLEGVTQIEIGAGGHEGFDRMLRAVLRQDPDVIMLGEIRDRETAETALTAAVTGHLVLSTVHAGSCFEVMARLSQLGVAPQLLSLSLRLISSQRLLPLNCRHCTERFKVNDVFRKLFRIGLAEPILAAKGCGYCRWTGIYGRRGVFEFLPITPGIREEILRGEQQGLENSLEERLRRLAAEQGFYPLAVQVRGLLLEGFISPETALRSLGMAPELFGIMEKSVFEAKDQETFTKT